MVVVLVAALILFGCGATVSAYGEIKVSRTYAARYAIRYGHAPPISLWLSTPVGDADVEWWRRRTIRFQATTIGLYGAALIVLLVGAALR